MKIKEHRDSPGATTTRRQAKGCIKRQKKGGSPAGKKRTLSSLSSVLCDNLESYERVLSCACEDKLSFCTIPELQSVLKVNGFQTRHLRKDYIEKNFSILNKALFQTRFSSIVVSGNPLVTAVALEDSEVAQDLAALQWLDGARKVLILLSPEEGTSLGECRPDCVSKVTLAGYADDLVESSTTNLSLKTSHSAYTPDEGSTDSVAMSADDCYRPDMSMVVMLDSIQADLSPSMYSPDQRNILCSHIEFLIHGLASQPEGGLLNEPSMPFFCSLEQPSHLMPMIASHGISDSVIQEEHGTQTNHTFVANIGFSEARAKLESEEKDVAQSLDENSSVPCSLSFINGGVLAIPDQSHWTSAFCTKNHLIFEQESEPLEQPNCGEASEGEEESSYSSISSPGPLEEPAQSSPLFLNSGHNAIASQHIYQTEVKSASHEKIDLLEKFAMEALELNILPSLFRGDDISGIQVLDETVFQGNVQTVANVRDFVKLEEDQSSNSSQIQEVQLHSAAYVVPSPQLTSGEDLSSNSNQSQEGQHNSPAFVVPRPQLVSAEGNFVGFLGLLAQVSAQQMNSTAPTPL